MPRQRRLRRVVAPPNFIGYKPYGTQVDDKESIEFLYEEYEALKLADYELMNHEEAAKLMGVSRPTFARIYEGARRKIAKALVETREIKTVYGNVIMDKTWFECVECHAQFNIPKRIKNYACPICVSKKIESLDK